jgi:hypothetical protein
MNDGFIMKYSLTFIQQIKMLVGIMNLILVKLVNLQNITKGNFMVGILIVGRCLTIHLMTLIFMGKLENYL